MANSSDIKARVKESYDAIAEVYGKEFTKSDDTIRLGWIRKLVDELRAQNKDKAAVLELGCGSGIPATKFMLETDNPTIDVVANDISTTQLEFAHSNLKSFEDEGRVKLIEGDMHSLTFPDSAFDAVTGFYSIIHLPREEQTQMMTKLAQWLRPGGLFLANFATAESVANENDQWLGQEKGWMYWSAWGEEGSVSMVQSAGFEILSRQKMQAEGDAEFVWILAKKI